MRSPLAEQWRQAKKEELDSLISRSVWQLVPRPPNSNVVSCKWVYKTKEDNQGNPVRYKARLVARGFTQVEGIDYEETFAPTAKFVTIRLIIALATSLHWPLEQADIDTAFLWSDIKEDIFMQQPEGHVDENHPDYVCKLMKSLYGLKQSAHLWDRLLSKTLKTFGFTQLLTDTSCFVQSNQDGTTVIMAVYVDDLVITGRTPALVQKTITDLKEHFQVKELGPVKWVLGYPLIEILKGESQQSARRNTSTTWSTGLDNKMQHLWDCLTQEGTKSSQKMLSTATQRWQACIDQSLAAYYMLQSLLAQILMRQLLASADLCSRQRQST